MRNISFDKFEMVKILETQGLGSEVYEGIFEGRPVIIKFQNFGYKFLHLREKRVLRKQSENIVEFIGYGHREGIEFIVIEKLMPVPETVTIDKGVEYLSCILIESRKLYLDKISWMASQKHIGIDIRDNIKIYDFNDLSYDLNDWKFFSPPKEHPGLDIIGFLKSLCKKWSLPPKAMDMAIYNLIEWEYQSIENVHEPIYLEPYRDIKCWKHERFEVPNRMCMDRSDLILDAVGNNGGTVLDIGCNMGWFSFLLANNNFDVRGIEMDGQKVDFCNMLSDMHNTSSVFECKDIDLSYAYDMPKYDIILALSVLHLYYDQVIAEDKGVDYFLEFFSTLCNKCSILIFEVPSSFMKIGNNKDIRNFVKKYGEFETIEIAGRTDAKRDLLICRRYK